MPDVARVVVGFDGSPEAEVALAWAISASHRRHVPLVVVIASGEPFYSADNAVSIPGPMLAEAWASSARDLVARSADVDSEGVEHRVVISALRPSNALIRESGPDTLTVVGAVGHGRIAGVFLGSVSQHVARHAAGTVVVVRAVPPQADRIVVGIDGSPESQAALEFALTEADRDGARVAAIYALRPRGMRGLGPAGAGNADRLDGVQDAQRLVAETTAGYGEKFPDVQLEPEVVTSDAVRALTDASSRATMVVVGARGRGAFSGISIGSVSQGVLQDSRCTVAIVR
jgi:nucleotide-binding universal stress UspA family protein